jgi:uncharacterized membrane protein
MVLRPGMRRRLLRAPVVGGISSATAQPGYPRSAGHIHEYGPEVGSNSDVSARDELGLGTSKVGPVQVVVVGLADGEFVRQILPQLRQLRGGNVVHLLDAIFVSKDEEGCLTTPDVRDVAGGEWSECGETVGALIGFGTLSEQGLLVGAGAGAADGARAGDTGEAWAISDAIPAGTCAALALIEHRWAIPLRGAIGRGGGFVLEDTWVHPADLIAVGAVVRD